MATRPINTQLQLIMKTTGALSREGFALLHQLREDVSNPNLVNLSSLSIDGFIAHTALNTFTARSLVPPPEGLTITNPSGVGGNPIFAFANDLAALEALGSTGFPSRTAADTYAQRVLTGTANQIVVTYGDGVSGNPVFELSVGDILNDVYTPGLTNGANVTASVATESFYTRIGSRVMVWGTVAITPTVITTATEISIDLPIASNFGAAADCMGTAAARDILSSGGIDADAGADKARLRFISAGVASTDYHYSFGYKII